MVHTPAQRLEMRRLGDACALRTRWRLLACVSMLRTGATGLIPSAGAAAWWTLAVSLLPGMGLYLLCRLGMKRSGAATLPECIRIRWGKTGVALYGVAMALALVWEGVSSLTALSTLFTEGVGARGTQFTMALAAAGMLLCCDDTGLARGTYSLRIPLGAALLAALGGLLALLRPDHLFPWQGEGLRAVQRAGVYAMGSGWVFITPLMTEPAGRRRAWEPLPPAAVCVACILCLNLAIPHESLVRQASLAESLLLTVTFQGAMTRLVCICLWTVGLFLCVGICSSMASQCILLSSGRRWKPLPGVITLGLAAMMLLDGHALWQWLGQNSPWLLAVPGMASGLACLGRRRKVP